MISPARLYLIHQVQDPVYLCNHHVAVKCASAESFGGLVDVASDLGDDGRSKGDVGDKVAVPIPAVNNLTQSPHG